MFGDNFWLLQLEGCYRHHEGGSQGCCEAFHSAQDRPQDKQSSHPKHLKFQS